MLFNSLQFCLFLPFVVVLAWALRRSPTLRMVMLLIASYVFYMSWNYHYAVLLVGSTLLDYVVGLQMPKRRTAGARRLLLMASLAGNLGILVYFKYFNFLWGALVSGIGHSGMSLPDLSHSFLLPVGISFYTFQSLSYTIDIYRGKLTPSRSFVKFALFVSFFPQLVAGPIVRASHFLPQLDKDAVFDDAAAQHGLYLILIGLFKKVCIADVLAGAFLDRVFADPGAFGSGQLLLAAYGYSFQIYCDFSGYSDIAIGAAAILGFHLPLNFDGPFRAITLRDFWRRWHISLSTWLRDYLYIPLGGSRISSVRTYANLAITMLLGGLWHGANWTFVIWGAMHGAYLAIERALGIDRLDGSKMTLAQRLPRQIVTFHVVVFTFLVFRCDSLTTLAAFLKQFLAMTPGVMTSGDGAIPVLFYVALALAAASHWCPSRWIADCAQRFCVQAPYRQAALVTAGLLLFTVLSQPSTPFIYFQF